MPPRFGILMFDELFDCFVAALPRRLKHKSWTANDALQGCRNHTAQVTSGDRKSFRMCPEGSVADAFVSSFQDWVAGR